MCAQTAGSSRRCIAACRHAVRPCTGRQLTLNARRRLLEARPDVQLTIFADQFGSDLTSAGAAGVWQPYKLSETPEVLTER